MISSALAMMLLVAAPDASGQARKDFARCINQFVKDGVEKKMEPGAFDGAIDSACKDKEAAFQAALVGGYVSTGVKRPEAERMVVEQIADYRITAKESFREFAAPAAETASAATTPQ